MSDPGNDKINHALNQLHDCLNEINAAENLYIAADDIKRFETDMLMILPPKYLKKEDARELKQLLDNDNAHLSEDKIFKKRKALQDSKENIQKHINELSSDATPNDEHIIDSIYTVTSAREIINDVFESGYLDRQISIYNTYIKLEEIYSSFLADKHLADNEDMPATHKEKDEVNLVLNQLHDCLNEINEAENLYIAADDFRRFHTAMLMILPSEYLKKEEAKGLKQLLDNDHAHLSEDKIFKKRKALQNSKEIIQNYIDELSQNTTPKDDHIIDSIYTVTSAVEIMNEMSASGYLDRQREIHDTYKLDIRFSNHIANEKLTIHREKLAEITGKKTRTPQGGEAKRYEFSKERDTLFHRDSNAQQKASTIQNKASNTQDKTANAVEKPNTVKGLISDLPSFPKRPPMRNK